MKQLLEEIVKNPPLWIIATIVAAIVSHALHKIISAILGHHKGPNGVVIIMELFMIFILGYLTLHAFAENSIKENSEIYEKWVMLIVFLGFSMGSVFIYVLILRLLKWVENS